MNRYGVKIDIFDTDQKKIGIGQANIIDDKILFNPCTSMPIKYFIRESDTDGPMQERSTLSRYLMDGWKPGDDIFLHVDDKTHENRTPEELDAMFEEFREVIGKHGFDLNTWGLRENMYGWLKRLTDSNNGN